MKIPSFPIICLNFLCIFASASALEIPKVFPDHMVLQQGRPLPVWGKAEPGAAITVSFGEQTVNATADAQGLFRAELAAVPASAIPAELKVSSANNPRDANLVSKERLPAPPFELRAQPAN
jgi:sialate O-acetylesterase